MRPVLVEVAGLEVTSYGASKALAALVVGLVLATELRRRDRDPDAAYSLTTAGVVGGFAGAKRGLWRWTASAWTTG